MAAFMVVLAVGLTVVNQDVPAVAGSNPQIAPKEPLEAKYRFAVLTRGHQELYLFVTNKLTFRDGCAWVRPGYCVLFSRKHDGTWCRIKILKQTHFRLQFDREVANPADLDMAELKFIWCDRHGIPVGSSED